MSILEIIIAFLGITLTLFFSIYSIYRSKKSFPKVELSLIRNECFALAHKEYEEFGIQIVYQERTVINPIILLKATLTNTGSQDIDSNLIFQPVKILTSSNYKWLQSKVKSCPPNSNIKTQINQKNELIIEWDLLKANESIEIEIVIEDTKNCSSEPSSIIDFYDNIKFEHRITNLNCIKKDSYTYSYRKAYRNSFIKWLLMGFIYLACGGVLIFTEYIFPANEIIYTVHHEDKSFQAKISAHSNTIFLLDEFEINKKLELTDEQFNKQYIIDSIQSRKKHLETTIYFQIFGVLIALFSSYFFRKSYYYYYKKRNHPNKL